MGLYPPPISQQEYEEILIENYGAFAPEVAAVYPLSAYDNNGFKAVEAIIGDFLFVCPSQFIVEAVNSPNTINNMSFMYLFNHTPSWVPKYLGTGAYHSSELTFVFGYNPDGGFTLDERSLSDNMTMWWTDFAKHGNPNAINENPYWPRYTNTLHQRILFTTESPTYINEFRATECELWRTYYSLYGVISPPKFLQFASKFL